MRGYQFPLINVDRLIKLGEVERALARVFSPAPSRPTIVEWIEEGLLEGIQIGNGKNHFVYESSLTNFIQRTQSATQKIAA